MARMNKTAFLAAASAVGAAGFIIGWPHVAARGLRVLFPGVVWDINTSERMVALSFDDGPDPVFTPRVLEILRRFNVSATFFLVGERVRRFPELLPQIRGEGHFVGNHSDSWHRTIQLGDDDFVRDLLRAEDSLGLHDQPKLFRPAGGMIRPGQMRLLRQHGYSTVLGSAYAFDPYRPPRQYIQWVIGRGLKPGAIIVLHDSGGDRSNTVDALPAIIEKAQKAGFRFVRLSEHVPPR